MKNRRLLLGLVLIRDHPPRRFAGSAQAIAVLARAQQDTVWDRTQAQINACPDLALGNLTWGWLDFAFKATALLRHDPAVTRVQIPVLIVAATP